MRVFLAVLVMSAGTMFGGALTTDTWEEFLFSTTGTFATGCLGVCGATTDPVADQSLAAPFTYTGAGTLQVLDLFVAGDQFAVFDNSVLLADTSTPTNTGADPCNNDIGCALADPTDYSYLDYALGGGPHSITIEVIQNAAGAPGGGAAVLEITSSAAVPEPATFALIAGGLALVGFKRWQKSR
jgi:hypothetical protein